MQTDLSSYSAILFDKDGTIFDSERVSCDAWLRAADIFGVPFSEQDFANFIGIPTDECYLLAHTKFGPNFDMASFKIEVRNYINIQKNSGLPIKKGFDAFFEYVKTLNIPLGLVTSAGKESTEISFTSTQYMQCFDIVVTVEDVCHPKPAPDAYLLACERLNVSPNNVLVFEDSNLGIQAALAAGCMTIAIPDMLEIDASLKQECFAELTCFESVADFFKISLDNSPIQIHTT